MSAVAIVIPGGFSSIAVRNAARLYEPARRLPQMASTLIPLASLIRFSPGLAGDPLSHLDGTGKTVTRRGRDRTPGRPAQNLCRGKVASKHLTRAIGASLGR